MHVHEVLLEVDAQNLKCFVNHKQLEGNLLHEAEIADHFLQRLGTESAQLHWRTQQFVAHTLLNLYGQLERVDSHLLQIISHSQVLEGL